MLKFLQSLLVLAAILFAIVVSWPSLLGMQREMVIAQMVSARGLIVVAALGIIVLLIVLSLMFRSLRGIATSLSIVLLLTAAFNGLVVYSNGWDNPDAGTLLESSQDELTVLAWNTLGNQPGAETIAQLAINSNAQIVSLPETTLSTVEEVAQRMAAAGMPMQVFHRALNQSAAAKSTGLLVSRDLGAYHLVTNAGDTSQLPSLIVQSETGPKIVAVHAVAPLPNYFEGWNNDLNWIAAHCNSPNTIIAGDFNATLDHFIGLGEGSGDLGQCRDAAKQLNAAGHGTWPTTLPSQISLPIDHILAGSSWTPSYFRTITELDNSGSDHRPVVARFHSN